MRPGLISVIIRKKKSSLSKTHDCVCWKTYVKQTGTKTGSEHERPARKGIMMNKISMAPTNDYCPQTLFLYGTCDDAGKADFGLFCWLSYIWDGELGVMACIGGQKLTKENIHRRKVFSANLVTEALLPLADYLGNTDGNDPEKMKGLNLETEVQLETSDQNMWDDLKKRAEKFAE